MGRKLILSLALALLFYSPAYASSATMPAEAPNVVISMQQWNDLKRTIAAQELTLNQLKTTLQTLRQNSSEQTQAWIELNNQLTNSKIALMKAQDSLTEANSSYQKVSESLKNNELLLTQLKRDIEAERREHKKQLVKFTVGALMVGYIAGRI